MSLQNDTYCYLVGWEGCWTEGFRHGDADGAFLRDVEGPFVAGVGVADDAHAGVVGEEAFELFRGEVRTISHRNLAGVDGTADPHAAAVVQRDPGGAGGGVEQGVQHGPVG